MRRFRIDVMSQDGSARLESLDMNKVIEARMSESQDGVHSLKLVVPRTWPFSDVLVPRNQLWVVDVDKAITSLVLGKKFRIHMPATNNNSSSGPLIEIVAEHILNDLGEDVIAKHETFAQITVATVFDKIMSGARDYTGITPTDTYPILTSFEIGGKSRLESLRELAKAVNARVTMNDAKEVGLTPIEDAAATSKAMFHSRSNLRDLVVSQDTRNMANCMYGIGSGDPRLTLEGTWHPVVSVGQTADEAQVDASKIATGDSSFMPAAARTGVRFFLEFRSQDDDASWGQWLGNYFEITNFQPLAASDFDRFTINRKEATKPWAAGDGKFDFGVAGFTEKSFRIWLDNNTGTYDPTQWTLVDCVEHYHDGSAESGGIENYGQIDAVVEDSSLEFAENLAVTPFFPSVQDINLYGAATITDNTDLTYVKNGTKSKKVVCTAPMQGGYLDFHMGDKVQTRQGNKYFSIKALIYVLQGKVKLDVSEGVRALAVDDRGILFPPPESSDETVITKTGFVEIAFNGLNNDAGTDGRLWIYQYGEDAATFYVDSWMVTPSQSVPEDWFETSSKRRLWDQCYDKLTQVNGPQMRYEANVRDRFLEDVDSLADFGTHDYIDIIAPDIETNAKRLLVVKKDVNLLDSGDVTIELATRKQSALDEISILALQSIRIARHTAANVAKIARMQVSKVPIKSTAATDPSQEDKAKSPQVIGAAQYHGRGQVLMAYYQGFVFSGCPFMPKLIIEPGYVGVPIFMPCETSHLNSTDADLPSYFNDWSMISWLNRAGTGLKANGCYAVSSTDPTLTRWYMGWKFGVMEWNKWINYGSYTMDRTDVFTTQIPPGTYQFPVLAAMPIDNGGALGERENLNGNLLILKKPVARAVLKTSVSAGAVGFYIEMPTAVASTNHGQGILPYYGKVKIGEGANQETVKIEASRVAAGAFDPSYRRLKTGDTLANAHTKGAPIIEEYSGYAE